MDLRATHTMLHEQAIYQHEGEQYQVERLDFENHKAFVRKVEPDYFTDRDDYTCAWRASRGVQRESARASLRAAAKSRVVEKVVGYKKIKFHTHENVGYGEVRLARDADAHDGVLADGARRLVRRVAAHARAMVIDALRGIGNALHTVASIGLMTDPRDLGHTIGDRSEPRWPAGQGRGRPASIRPIFLYDRIPGGMGWRRGCSRRATSCWCARAGLHRGLRLRAGCPACVGPGWASWCTPSGGDS